MAASSTKASRPNQPTSPPSSSTNWRRSSPNDQMTNCPIPSHDQPPHLPQPSSPHQTIPTAPKGSVSRRDSGRIASSNYSSPLSSPPPSATPTVHFTADEPVTATLHLGMERGYSLSPMYSLILEYNLEKGSNVSTTMEVSWILLHPNLNLSDIAHKTGEGVDPYTSIYVKEERLMRILRTVNKMQTLLHCMADLIQERSQVFCIDPQDTMVTALQGCESRSQLDMAYKILVKQLQIAQQTVMKYEAEYQGNDIPLSPVSTAPELYSDFDQIENVDGHMRYLLGNILHHQGHLTPSANQAVKEGVSWHVIHPTQALMWDEPVRERLPVPSHVSDLNSTEAKKKVGWGDYSPWFDNNPSIEQGCDYASGLELSFGFQTPFRTGKQFLEQPNNSSSAVFFSTPQDTYNVTPNVTIGLATPSRSNLGDSVREEFRQGSTSATQNNAPTSNNPVSNQIMRAQTDPVSSLPPTSQMSKNDSHPGGESPPYRRGPPDGNRGGDSLNGHHRGGGGGFPPSGGGDGGFPPSGGGGGGFPPSGGGGGGGGGFPPSGNGNSGNEGHIPSLGLPSRNRDLPPQGGGGNHPPGPGSTGWPQALYRNMPASIKTELKVEQLPEWDGNHGTTIDY